MSGGSSSVAVSPPLRHDVFLSFRGEDTRDNFTSHLYAELRKKNVETFIDYRLGRGEEISPALHKAIEESMIYVIIFSEHYASSTWCLYELAKILECKKRYGRDVIPVFYKVDPSIVRNQRERFAEAFVKHEERFKKNLKRVHEWKTALTEAAGFSGWDSQVTRPESTLVAEIVKDILRKLNRSSIGEHRGIIGIHNHIAKIQSLLHLESPAMAIRIVGIWGMGGIGKTVLASEIYHKLAMQFSSSSLVLNCQEEIERHGIQHIKRKYFSELLEEDNPSFASSFSNKRLKRAKVLLILDDVNNSGQVKDLIGEHGNFGQGSSRDMQVLKNAEADEIYQVKEMNSQDSLRLFSLNAFKQNHPIETYRDLSVKILDYAKGIPLALKVLGSFLYGRTRKAWESELQKLEKIPDLEIFNVLKLSYDRLDEEQKDMFLDIACFYRGEKEVVVAQRLDGCGFSADIGMDVLKDRCLISVLEGRIVMHDLIHEMGQEIVRQQGVKNSGECSRLWKHEEIYRVLKFDEGTNAIQCIFLDMCKIKKIELQADTFKKMRNLRILEFFKSYDIWKESNVYLPAFLESFPDDLKFLRWDGFPQRCLPLDFCPEKLVKLDMRNSHLKQLWEEDQHLPNLKRLDLSYSDKLIRIPDLSLSPNIEEINLNYCVSLIQVYSSGFLSKLNCLCLYGCVKLRNLNLPSNILSISSGIIVLYNCRQLTTFSISSRTEVVQLYGSSHSDVSWGAIRRFPGRLRRRCATTVFFQRARDRVSDDSDRYVEGEPMDIIHLLNIRQRMKEFTPSLFPSLNELCWLDLSSCESLTTLPFDLSDLKFLRRLYLSGCSKLENFPEIKGRMENLTMLSLGQTAIMELPSSLHHLVQLEDLSLHGCQRLVIIPSSIGSLSKLCKLDLTCCESLESFPSSIFKLKLTKLDLHGCSMLRTFPEILEPAESFAHIDLTRTAIKELPPSLDNLVELRTLNLNLCSDLESLPNSIVNLNLQLLNCSGCGKLTKLPSDIGRLPSLRELSLNESGIVNLPESIAYLSSLKSLDVSDCKMLECIPQLPPFLKQLLAFDCPSIRRVMPISRIKIPSNSQESVFKFHFTNSQELDPSGRVHIVDDARIRITEDAYRSVFFCLPGSEVPHWFPCHSKGHSVTINPDSLNLCNDKRLIGFALCVVLGLLDIDIDMDDTKGRYACFSYRVKFECDDGIHTLLGHDELRSNFYWNGRERTVHQDHTLLWKYNLESAGMHHTLCNVHSFTFELSEDDSHSNSIVTVKECGIYPLYAGDYSGFLRFSKDDIGETSGSKVA